MTDSSRIGSVIASKYRLDEELGRGGMGVVYRAYHLRVHKVFAIKVLLSDALKHRSIASRFLLEAQAAGRIGHPGILDVYDVGEDDDGTPFIVMELLRGEALSALVQRERLEVSAACWIAMEVLDVLEAAHRAGIVHRDVKPQNVFITERVGDAGPTSGKTPPTQGVTHGVKLLDFGVAKFGTSGDMTALTRSGEIIGSPLYMAPEQAKGELDLDARADVWSVGAMLFEMLTGTCAHAATTPVAVLAKILTEHAPSPSTKDERVPPELDVVVSRALRIDRHERWGSALEMREALAAAIATISVADEPVVIPAAPKRAAPAPSPDRTPGAISATLVQSSIPARPWSSPPSNEARSGQEEPAVASSRASGPMRLATAAAVVAALAIVAMYIYPAASRDPSTAATTASLGAVPSGVPSATSASAVASTTGGTVESSPPAPGDASNSASAVATAGSSAAAPALSPLASSSAPAGEDSRAPANPARPAPPPAAKCASNEDLSHGHCCPRGLAWQSGHCERPLATSF